ncbi:MAG: hypothetical protein JW953_14650 [Anaerolineae bacterium]|nr:hypothetical protein [Anaerolineae bacterium]
MSSQKNNQNLQLYKIRHSLAHVMAQAASERFNLNFINSEGQEETPLCIHRAPLNTHERMIGFLIEHYAGKFPVWLCPEQVQIVPITEVHNEYALQLKKCLQDAKIRAQADLGAERMNAKIRQAQLMQVPYMLIVGDREMENETVSLRRRDNTRQNDLPVAEFITTTQNCITTRSGEL